MNRPHTGTSIHASKIDLWLIAVTALSVATSTGALLAVSLKGGVPAAVLASTALLLLVAGIGLPLWVLLGTRYELTPERLLVRCGPFRWTVPLREIRAVTPTRSPLSSPALSLDRLRIDYGRGSSVMISPRDKAGFLADLERYR
jgi:hypothetical protein